MSNLLTIGLAVLATALAVIVLLIVVVVVRFVRGITKIGTALRERVKRQQGAVINVIRFVRKQRQRGQFLVVPFTLHVYPVAAPPYQITTRMVISRANFARLQPGYLVRGTYDPQDPAKIMFNFDQELTPAEQAQAAATIAQHHTPLPRVHASMAKFSMFIWGLFSLSIIGVVTGSVLIIMSFFMR